MNNEKKQIPFMHPHIHVSISYSFKKKIITCHASSHHVIHHTPQNHWKSFPKKKRNLKKKINN